MRLARTPRSFSRWNCLVSTKILKSSLSGEMTIPPSKSQTMRALVFALMSTELSIIRNALVSPDSQAMVRALRLLGARVDCYEDRIEVRGGLRPAEDVIDCGNSGLVLRLVGAVAGLLPSYTVLTGDSSIRHRRVAQPLIHGINQLGGCAVSARGDGHAPLIVRGVMRGGKAVMDGADSQPVSGLLIAAAFAEGVTELVVRNAGEKPWVGLTLGWLERFGVRVENREFEEYRVWGGTRVRGFEYTVPGDWSSALYPIVAAVVTGSEVTVHGVEWEDLQGDKRVVEVLREMGAKIAVEGRSVRVEKGGELKGCRIDVGQFIDAMTLLPVVACCARGKTEIYNGKIARSKESDRIKSIVSELKKMGAHITETEDGMVVEPSRLVGAEVGCYEDHRMAMSLAVAGLIAEGTTEITGVEVVAKSFPGYFESMRKLGMRIE